LKLSFIVSSDADILILFLFYIDIIVDVPVIIAEGHPPLVTENPVLAIGIPETINVPPPTIIPVPHENETTLNPPVIATALPVSCNIGFPDIIIPVSGYTLCGQVHIPGATSETVAAFILSSF